MGYTPQVVNRKAAAVAVGNPAPHLDSTPISRNSPRITSLRYTVAELLYNQILSEKRQGPPLP